MALKLYRSAIVFIININNPGIIGYFPNPKVMSEVVVLPIFVKEQVKNVVSLIA